MLIEFAKAGNMQADSHRPAERTIGTVERNWRRTNGAAGYGAIAETRAKSVVALGFYSTADTEVSLHSKLLVLRLTFDF